MNFDYLVNHQEHIPIIANWFYEQWGQTNPGRTKAQVVAMIHNHLNEDKLPLSFVGLEKKSLMGVVLLREFDLKESQQYSPWLSSLYVAPNFRNKGYGQQLVKQCMLAAKKRKFNQIFLYTKKDLEHWYAAMGWAIIDSVMHGGSLVSIMTQKL